MILIKKNSPSQSIKENIAEVKSGVSWTAICREKDVTKARATFDQLDKGQIKKALYKEQHGICAYCMRKIASLDDMVIEHVQPLSEHVDQALDYSNWAGSCDGGRTVEEDSRKVLCCDAAKGNQEIHIDMYDPRQMAKIRYRTNGMIYTYPPDDVMENDINHVLNLNGIAQDGKVIEDTSTRVVQGRREAYRSCVVLFESLAKRKQLTAERLEKRADQLLAQDSYDQFVGVKVYFLRKRAGAIRKGERK